MRACCAQIERAQPHPSEYYAPGVETAGFEFCGAYIPTRQPSNHEAARLWDSKWIPAQIGLRMIEMKRASFLAGICLTAFLAAVPAFAQTDNKPKEPPKPALGPAESALEQWNDIGRKIVAIAEDLPEDKYDYKPAPDVRSFVQVVLHVSASMYYFTDPAQGQKPRYPDDPNRDQLNLKTKAQIVAFVKKCVQDGADVIKAKGDAGMSTAVFAGGPRLTRVDALIYGLNEHSGEHYGQLVAYYRANGMVPPESRPKK